MKNNSMTVYPQMSCDETIKGNKVNFSSEFFSRKT